MEIVAFFSSQFFEKCVLSVALVTYYFALAILSNMAFAVTLEAFS